MDKSQLRVRPRFLLGLIVVFVIIPILASYLLPVSISGKPTTRDLARMACRAYLDYAKNAAINGKFQFDRTQFLEFATTNYNFSQVGVGYTRSTDESAIRHAELYSSFRSIFNTNQNFWTKTNFSINSLGREPVIVCKQQFYFPRTKNYFGWSYTRLKPAFVIGYSDGTTALISEDEFSSLNLDHFVPFSSLGIEGFYLQFNG
ncbi:MAG TPA: hypothetical protein VFV23_05375 [Verrucomicrobiae bacterium]|nr:hypothetical protein [Verrucomicrobiae bacterium]